MRDHLFSGIPPVLWKRAAAANHRLLVLGYDGTLAPYAAEQPEAGPIVRSLDLGRKIASQGRTTLAIFSARPVRELESLAGLFPAWLVGEHGWEIRSPDRESSRHFLPREARIALGRATTTAIERGWGERIERMRTGLVLHTRGMLPGEASALERECQEAWGEWTSATVLRIVRMRWGIELRAVGRDKGTAVTDLIRHAVPGTFPVYLGDDETDENAFAELRESGLGVRVGPETGVTIARGRLDSWASVMSFLEGWLADVESVPVNVRSSR